VRPVGARRLLAVFLVATAGWGAIQAWGFRQAPHPRRDAMHRAEARTRAAFAAVDSVKRARGLMTGVSSPVRWRALLGEDYTPITTTLGSLSAKEAATNPAWAAVMVRLLDEAGVRRGDAVGILASGSFPSLNLATLAAVQELGARSYLVVSLGASSYGANGRLATWLDIEDWARGAGAVSVTRELVTPGAEDDNGGGMDDEGKAWLEEALARSSRTALSSKGLEDAIAARLAFLNAPGLAAVVNIGGGQAALGRCPHAESLPAGRWPATPICACPGRGALTRLHDRGTPVINLLSIRELAMRYGLDPEPGAEYRDAGRPDLVRRADRGLTLAGLALIALALGWCRRPARGSCTSTD
jgi:poly-gamma-glutamate system protein